VIERYGASYFVGRLKQIDRKRKIRPLLNVPKFSLYRLYSLRSGNLTETTQKCAYIAVCLCVVSCVRNKLYIKIAINARLQLLITQLT